MIQPELLQPSWPYYNIIDSSLEEDGLYSLPIDAHIDDCDFSSSFTTNTEDSSDISSNPILNMYSHELVVLPGDDMQFMLPLEQNSPNLEELDLILNGPLISDEIEDMSGWKEESESLHPSQLYFIEEEGERSPRISAQSSEMFLDVTAIQPPLVLPEEDMVINNQFSIPHLLKEYGEAMEKEQAVLAEVILKRISEKVSPLGTTVERLAYYLIQALDKQGDYLKQESSKNYEAAFRAFYQIFPYGRFAHFTANSAILEAIPQDAEMIHIVDFDLGEGVQWPPLLEALGRQRAVRLTSIKWMDEDSSFIPPQWRFEETKKRLHDHARSFGQKLKVEEMHLEKLVSEIKKTKKRGGGRECLAFNCMVGLPHMRKERSRRQAMAFINLAKELNNNPVNRGIITLGDGDAVEESTGSRFGSFFDGYFVHFCALFESMEWHFPLHLTQARMVMECLFVAPHVSSVGCIQKWKEMREGCVLQSGFGLQGWRLSEKNLVEAREIVSEGEGLYGVRVGGESENEMILEWKGTPLVRVSTWR